METNHYKDIKSTLVETQSGVITPLARICSVVTFGNHCWGCSGSYSYRCSYKKVGGKKGRTDLSASRRGTKRQADPIELGLLVEGWLSLDWKRPRIDGGCRLYYTEKESDGICESLVARNSACSENAFFTLIPTSLRESYARFRRVNAESTFVKWNNNRN